MNWKWVKKHWLGWVLVLILGWGQTPSNLQAASTLDESIKSAEGDKTAKAKLVGALVAERAREAGISAVVFDRGGYQYHGRVAALADSAREAGLTL